MGIFSFWINLASVPDSVAFPQLYPLLLLFFLNQECFEKEQLRVAEFNQYFPVSFASKTTIIKKSYILEWRGFSNHVG